MLIDTIRKHRLEARKAQDLGTSTILTTLVGEVEGQAKRTGDEISDELVFKTIKKFLVNIRETIKIVEEKNTELSVLSQMRAEEAALERYLPKQLTADEIRAIITSLNAKHIGEVMKHFKSHFSNSEYDGRVASSIAKEVLQ